MLVAALIVNIMLNLTTISESVSRNIQQETRQTKSGSSLWRMAFLLSFPIIGFLLYLGDNITKQAKGRSLLTNEGQRGRNVSSQVQRIPL